MFNIENNPLKDDIDKIIYYPHDGTNKQTYELILHTVEHDINITVIEDIETMRDYNKNHTDYIVLTFHMPLGDYIKYVYPYRDNLEITTIKKVGIKESKIKYKFVILNTDNDITGGVVDYVTNIDLNKAGYVKIIGQALYREVEAIRKLTVTKVFHNTTVKQVIISALYNKIKDMTIAGKNIELQIHMIEPDNKRVYEHIIIPNNVNILDLPTYLDNKDYGVYNGFTGTYLQMYKDKFTLFIYPLYNHISVRGKTDELIVYQIPSHMFELIDRTYIVDGKTISILAGESTTRIDQSDSKLMDIGTGFRSMEPNAIMNRPVIVNENSIVSKESELIHKKKIKNLDDQVNNTIVIQPTDNLYKERSKLIKDSGSMLQLQWNFSYSELLYPGMAVTYIYLKGKDIIKRRGVLNSVYDLNKPYKEMTISLLNIFIENLNKGWNNNEPVTKI